MSAALLLAPLRVEHAALCAGLRGGGPAARHGAPGRTARPGPVHVRCTGMGPRRSVAALEELVARRSPPGAVVVAGVGGGLVPTVRPGDVVVATQVLTPDGTVVALPAAPLLALALRWSGLRVHAGPVLTCPRVVEGAQRTEMATSGALCVDTESAHLVGAVAPSAFAVVRVVVDTADRPLRSPGTVGRGLAALDGLRRAAPVLARWACAAAAGPSGAPSPQPPPTTS